MINVNQVEPKPRHVDDVISAPPSIAGKGICYPKTISGLVEFFYMDDAGTETQITEGGSLRLPNIPSLVPAGGSPGSILAKSTGVDFATAWFKPHQLINEFYFVLPKASTIDQRVTALGNVPGLELFSADNDGSPDAEFGALPSTLIIKPNGLSGVIVSDIDVMDLNEAGAIETQGWNKLGATVNFKTNKAQDRCGIIDFGSQLDIARDVFVRVRFFKPVMP